jgi:hypothetical protein
LIRELKEEIEALRKGGAVASKGGDAGAGGNSAADEEMERKLKEQAEAMAAMEQE